MDNWDEAEKEYERLADILKCSKEELIALCKAKQEEMITNWKRIIYDEMD